MKRLLSWATLERARNVFTMMASGAAVVIAVSALLFLSRAEIELDPPSVSFQIDEATLREELPSDLPEDVVATTVSIAGTHRPGNVFLIFEDSGYFSGLNAYWEIAGSGEPFQMESPCESSIARSLAKVYGDSNCLAGDVPLYAVGVVDQIRDSDNTQEEIIRAFERSKRIAVTVIAENTGSALARDVEVVGPSTYTASDPEGPFDLPAGDFTMVQFDGPLLVERWAGPVDEFVLYSASESDVEQEVQDGFFPKFDPEASSVVDYTLVTVTFWVLLTAVVLVVAGQIYRDWPTRR